MINNNWVLWNEFSPLKTDEVHVWCADLVLPEEKIEQLFNLLSADERQRAQRFYFPRDRARFIAARAILRKLLSQYSQISAEQLQFQYNAHGKPELIQAPNLQFNLSHANTKALIAVTYAPTVGVDVEYCEKELDIEGIAERFFTANEYQIIKNLTGSAKKQAFFTGWVRKEAFLKALGEGLAYSLAKVEVTLLPHEPARIIALYDAAQSSADWSMFVLPKITGYAAALVVKQAALKVITRQWDFCMG